MAALSLASAPAVMLSLAEDATGGSAAPWIGPLVALGSGVARHALAHQGRQLIVAVSVPQRDFAATLIGCGWAIAARPATLDNPLETFRRLSLGTPVRATTDLFVISGQFTMLNEAKHPAQVRVGRSTIHASRFTAVSVIDGPASSEQVARPTPGSLSRYVGIEATWDARLVRPAADLAMVGTLSWLRDDSRAHVSRQGNGAPPTCIADLLLPEGHNPATWSTRLYKSAALAEELPLPKDVRCAILDGSSAIKYLTEVETPVVICILDRSVADETAADIVVQLRNTRGESVGMGTDLLWQPPLGIEVLAFTVAL